ncbi:MAG: hypothetical protein ACI32N_03285 [Bulleidia sp.]
MNCGVNHTAFPLSDQIIADDPIIRAQLNHDGIPLSEVSDFHIYPVCDNPTPHLCIDRLEYTCGNLIGYGFGTRQDVNDILDDIVVSDNENGTQELCFRHRSTAGMFPLYALRCGTIYSSFMDRYAMERLSIILNQA